MRFMNRSNVLPCSSQQCSVEVLFRISYQMLQIDDVFAGSDAIHERIKHFAVFFTIVFRRKAVLAQGTRKHSPSRTALGMDWADWLAIQPKELVQALETDPETVVIDEIRPMASFDLTDPDQQACCCNWRNRQLLLAADNLSKGTNWDRSEWEAMMTAKGYVGNLF